MSEITEVHLYGKKKDRLEMMAAAMQAARQNFESLFNGIILGMNHDPDDEQCILLPSEGGGLKIKFGPKDSMNQDGTLKQPEQAPLVAPEETAESFVNGAVSD